MLLLNSWIAQGTGLSYRIVIVVLPLDTIVRILDHAHTAPGPAPKGGNSPTPSPSPGAGRSALAKNIIGALSKAKKEKASVVGPLEPSEFNALSAWCRNIGLIYEGEMVEAAVRASG
jgi:hypothetical protein